MKTQEQVTKAVEWLKSEMDALQVWFAGHTRAANPVGWDDRSRYYDECEEKLARLVEE